MINDMQSVRSLPIRSSQKQQARTHMPAPSIFSPSENSPLNSRAHRDWRNNLLPEIDEKYNRIMRGEQVKWAEGEGRWERWQGQGEERGGSTAKSSGAEALRREYEAKINALEEQNSNLKEELYYLREALLINFQNRKEK